MIHLLEVIMSEKQMLTRSEAAECLGVTTKFLDDAPKRCEGPPFYHYSTRTVLYDRSELAAWRDACRFDPKTLRTPK